MKYKVKQTINKNALSVDRHACDGVDVKNNEVFVSFTDPISTHKFEYKYCIQFNWCEKVEEEWRMMPSGGCPNYTIEAETNPDSGLFDELDNKSFN